MRTIFQSKDIIQQVELFEWPSYQCAYKAVEFGRFVTTGNDNLDMVKTNITGNISKASHVLGE